jgi:flagellar basal-body rod protein FlgF
VVKDGWFVVQAGGQLALTRNGVLAQSTGGLLTTQTGEPLIGADGAPISLPKLQKIEVSQDGTISGIPVGALIQQPQVYGQLMLASTPANGQLTPTGNSLYAIPSGAAPTPATNATVQQGYIEGSNVSSVSAMVEMLDTSRSFQLQTQIVQDTAKSEASLDQILLGQ